MCLQRPSCLTVVPGATQPRFCRKIYAKSKKLGLTKASQANYILKDILGDDACPQNESDEMRLEKVRTLMELDEDVVSDLRINNSKTFGQLLTM